MKISVLASGSKGNCTYIEYKNTRILIDLGVSITYIKNKLNEINVEIKDIDAILLTHTHADHIYGLPFFYKLYQTKLYISQGMKKDIDNITTNYTIINEEIKIADFTIKLIPTSHDCLVSVGFVIKTEQKEIVYITDTGYINVKYFNDLKNKDIYVLESNHDVEMLMNGKYPYHLKQRILSDIGHLSNQTCSTYLSNLVGEQTKCIILAHLSEENNKEEVALNTLITTMKKKGKQIDKIFISKQEERTELIEI